MEVDFSWMVLVAEAVGIGSVTAGVPLGTLQALPWDLYEHARVQARAIGSKQNEGSV